MALKTILCTKKYSTSHSLISRSCKNDHIIFNVGTLSLEARNIRLVNIITYIIEESKLISENMSPNVIHCYHRVIGFRGCYIRFHPVYRPCFYLPRKQIPPFYWHQKLPGNREYIKIRIYHRVIFLSIFVLLSIFRYSD
jgi:hypothetical protein